MACSIGSLASHAGGTVGKGSRWIRERVTSGVVGVGAVREKLGLMDALRVDGREEWQIVQGGVNRNVCIQTPTGACAGPLTARDIVIGGQKYRYQGNKTEYRTFWWAGEA